MRNWFFHPLLFYPLAILFAVFVIGLSLQPQAWPRTPAPISAAQAGGALVLEGAAFNSPAPAPEQNLTVTRDFFGQARTLRIAVHPRQPVPAPQEQGVRILLSEAGAAQLSRARLRVEVSYVPLPVNTADGLAVSVQGGGPTQWVSLPAPDEGGTLRFDVQGRPGANAIGLRALSGAEGQAFGLEITRIRITPLT